MQDTNITYEKFLERFFKVEKVGKYYLGPTQKACEYFGHPEKSFKSIHIGGTNGKGSVSKMVFQMLKDAGKKVGVLTSPHLIDIRERFETESGLISHEDFMKYAGQVLDYGEHLSYFERCALVAFLYFRDRECEYAVIEVGIGGRKDATNVITPIVSAITSVSWDHMDFLGNTLEAIAYEKGGIIKKGIPVVLYGHNEVLINIAHEVETPIYYKSEREVITNLLGAHQKENARLAYEIGTLIGLSGEQIQDSLLHVVHHGRLEYLTPNLLIDGAHNEAGLHTLHDYLEGVKNKWERIHYCIALKKGKPITLITDIFSEVLAWTIIEENGYNLSSPLWLTHELEGLGIQGTVSSPEDIKKATAKNREELYVVFGSLYGIGNFYAPNN